MIFIRDDIPSRLLNKHVFPDDIEGLFIELNFRKVKWGLSFQQCRQGPLFVQPL